MGTLTSRWVVSLTVPKLTPGTGLPSSAASASSEFDRPADASRRRVGQSVALPRGLPRKRSCYDMFRSEPAVAGLDGPFTPTRRSREGIVGHQPWRASTWLSPRFALSSCRSPGFGSYPVGSPRVSTAALVSRCERLRPCRFPCACPDDRVRLAGRVHSLVRFSKRTSGHRLRPTSTVGSPPVRSSVDLVCPVVLWPADCRPFAPPVVGCFAAFAHATGSLSVSRSV